MLKKLKSLFVIDDGKPEVKPKRKEDATAKKAESNPPAGKVVESIAKVNAAPGAVKSKFLEVLFGAMEKNDLEGFDYLEFKQFLKSLDSVDMDESTKFKSAFATAKTMGATLTVLRQSAGHYLEILKTEESKFAQAVQNQRQSNLVNKEKEIQTLGQAITDKEKQIALLQKEIESHKKLREKRKEEITKAATKVEQTKNDFAASYNALTGQIQSDLKKIDLYLKE